MADLFRDTAFGQIVRLVSGKKFFLYPDEKNPEIWKTAVDEKKSAYLAHHGDANPPEEDSESLNESNIQTVRSQENQGVLEAPAAGAPRRNPISSDSDSQRTQVPDNINAVSGVKVDPEKGRDIHLVTWYGPDDPENPQNWSLGKKFFVTAQLCLLTTSIYIGSSIYSAGTQNVIEIFGVSEVAATLGLCLFVAGYGTGPMLWSPMSEIPYIGRNPIYLGTLAVFVALQAPTALASNFGMLLAFRFLTGFFGSPVLATGGASLADIYSPKKRAYAMSIWGIAAVCGPTLGPLVGGYAVQLAPVGSGGFTAPWTWPIWELMWVSAFCFVFLFFTFPETSANNILLRRTQRLRKATGNEKLVCQPELMAQSMTGHEIIMMSLVKPFTLNFTEPMVFLLNLYIALIYGLLYIWFESFVIVFVQGYGFSLGEEGLAFLGILLGAFFVIPFFFYYLYHYLEPQFDENGDIQPEIRLQACCVGAFCIPICLFWFGWSANRTHWIVPIIGSSFFAIGTFLIFNSILNYLPDAYPEHAASVLAGNDLMRSAFGAGFPLFANAMYVKLGTAWASSTLAFISIAFIPIPFVLIKYGKGLRLNHSKAARKDI